MPPKREDAPSIVVDRLRIPAVATEPAAGSLTPSLDNAARRNFLRRTGTLASGALATGASLAGAAPLLIPDSHLSRTT